MGKDMENSNIEEVVNQLELEKQMLPLVPEMDETDLKKLVQGIKDKRQSLNMDCTAVDKALNSLK